MTVKKTSIALFQYDLGVGGVQKSLINLLNNLDYDKYSIDLYLCESENFFNNILPKYINVIKVKKFSKINKIMPFWIANKVYSKRFKTMPNYDVAVDFSSYQNECAIGSLNIPAHKRISWLHNDVRARIHNDFAFRVRWYLYHQKFKYFDNIVAVSKGITESFHLVTDISNSKITVVNNFVDTNNIVEKSKIQTTIKLSQDKYNLVAVGRLSYEKGYDIMLENFKEAIDIKKDLHLYIIGDGPERENIRKIIQELNLTNSVTLLGAQPNPYKYMRLMDGYISTSRHEGQGISILEAKCLGLDIFIPKHLEKYSYNIAATTNIPKAVATAKRKKHIIDYLKEYNNAIITNIDRLFNRADNA